MSFIVTGEDAPEGPQVYYELRAERLIRVPPIALAVVPHGITIVNLHPDSTEILLMRKPWAWAEMHLMVDMGSVNVTDPIVTRVFNLSSKEVTIKRGSIISYLLCIPIATL